MRAARLVCCAGVLALGAAACGDDPDPPWSEVAPDWLKEQAAAENDLGLTATVQQWREDEITHRMQIVVTNGGDLPVRVVTLRLHWDGMELIEPDAIDYPVAPGIRVQLPVDYGRSICSDPPQFVEVADTSVISADAVVEIEGGEQRQVSIPVTDAKGVLERVYRLDCRQQAVDYRVHVRLGTEWESLDGGTRLAGTLVLERAAGEGPVELLVVDGSVLIGLQLAEGAATTLDAGADELEIPVIIGSSGRCEPHAFADSKQTFVFQLSLRLEGEVVNISISPPKSDEPLMFDAITTACGV